MQSETREALLQPEAWLSALGELLPTTSFSFHFSFPKQKNSGSLFSHSANSP